MLDFDNIDDWAPSLAVALNKIVSSEVLASLATESHEFIEDALNSLFDAAGRDEIIDATIVWLSSTTLLCYHGSRLTDEEVESIRLGGLIPLKANMRRERLVRALSRHPAWNTVEVSLDNALQTYGGDGKAGQRESQVHLTLSRAGLLNNFNHYLTYGSEFDQHVAQALLPSDGLKLLTDDGIARVIQVAVPGKLALEAAHPYFSVEVLRNKGDVPNLVNEFLKAWSFRLARPAFQSRALLVDSGMVFKAVVPPMWIMQIDTLLKCENDSVDGT